MGKKIITTVDSRGDCPYGELQSDVNGCLSPYCAEMGQFIDGHGYYNDVFFIDVECPLEDE